MDKEQVAKEQMRAKLLKAAEAETAKLLEELAEWQVEHPKATWSEMEIEILKLRQRFGAQLARVLTRERGEKQAIPGPKCPKCGKEMHYKGQKKRDLVSLLGEVPLKRGYYYCSECRKSIFPPGSGTGITKGEKLE